MRLWIFAFSVIWGLIACTPPNTDLPVSPTDSPVHLIKEDVEIGLQSPDSWHAYVTDENIVLICDDDKAENMVINIWIPGFDMSDDVSFTDVVNDIASNIESEHELHVTRPTTITWGGHDAAYFLLANEDSATMILVVHVANDTVIAFNIRGLDSDFSALRPHLSEIFDAITINDVMPGSDILVEIPDTLMLPSLDLYTEPEQ